MTKPAAALIAVLFALAASFAAAPDDRAALVALYNAANGASWTNSDNWLTDRPLDEWRGVAANAAGRVTALRLPRNNLRGEPPAELGDLSSLRDLDIQGNFLSGAIPTSLGGLPRLANLDLSHNALSGAIPPALGESAALTDLHLGENALAGCIPRPLRDLPYSDLPSLGLRLCGD